MGRPTRSGLIGVVHHDRIDFGDPIDRNSIALLKCQWMMCGLKLDKWSKPVVAKMGWPTDSARRPR